MSKRFWGVIVAVIIILVVIFAVTNNGSAPSSNGSKPTNHVEGQGTTGVKLVEYGDYQCPDCGYYYPIVKQVAAVYNKYIYFQFRNLPLTSLHPNALAGARAAEAAAMQGKFWQMHDKLYEENDQYYAAEQQGQTYNTWINASDPSSDFDQYAQQLGLNVAKFKTDFASSKVNDLINADIAAFLDTPYANHNTQNEATPTFFLDGKHIQPTLSVASFEKLINAEIQKKTGKPSPVKVSATPTSGTSSTAPQSTAPQSKTTQKSKSQNKSGQ